MQPVPTGYPVVELTGPSIVGCLLNFGLFGTLSVQIYLYYLAFPNDRRFVKYLVYGIYIIEFAQTMLVAYDAFAMYGYGFGDLDSLTRTGLSGLTVPIMGAVAACIGQFFYAYRIFILSKSRIIPILIICISLINFGASMFAGIYAFQEVITAKLNTQKMHIAVGIWCGAAALCDILVAICMTYYLMRSTTNFRRTRMLVSKIVRLIIETGSMTAVAALLNGVLFIVLPHQSSYIALGLVLPKLYANSVYMVLNSRFRIIGGRDTYTSLTDMGITTTMIRDMISQSTEDTRPVDGAQRQLPVVVISGGIQQ